MNITLTMEKKTKNTVKFVEVCDGDPKIGSMYIPKTTLEEIGWKDNKEIIINLEVKG